MTDDLPEMDLQPATVITSEFTLAAIRYIAVLESAVGMTTHAGTAAYVAMFRIAGAEARQRFMASAELDDMWPRLNERRDVYRNLLDVMVDEVKKWERGDAS